jgi:hypothetical protein
MMRFSEQSLELTQLRCLLIQNGGHSRDAPTLCIQQRSRVQAVILCVFFTSLMEKSLFSGKEKCLFLFVGTVFTRVVYLVLAVTSVIQVKQVDRLSSTSTHFKMDPSEQISLH